MSSGFGEPKPPPLLRSAAHTPKQEREKDLNATSFAGVSPAAHDA
jgi:hypothetical protein